MSFQNILDTIEINGIENQAIYDIVDKITITLNTDKNNMLYKLKPEYHNSRTPFYPLYLLKSFYSAMANDNSSSKHALLPIPEIEHHFLDKIPAIVNSKPYIQLIQQIANFCFSCPNPNITTIQVLFSLFHISIEASKVLNDFTFADSLISSPDSPLVLLCSSRFFDNNDIIKPAIQLMSIIAHHFGSLSVITTPLISTYHHHITVSEAKVISRNSIQAQFHETLSKFYDQNQAELDEIKDDIHDPSEMICIFCKNEILIDQDTFGMLSYLRNFYFDDESNKLIPKLSTCYHLSHHNCYLNSISAQSPGLCPLCRKSYNCLLPLLFDSNNQNQSTLIQSLSNSLRTPIELYYLVIDYLKKFELLLQLTPGKNINKMEIHAIRSIIMLLWTEYVQPPVSLDPFITFLKTMQQISTHEQFWNFISLHFPDNISLSKIRRYIIAYNVFHLESPINLKVETSNPIFPKISQIQNNKLFLNSAYPLFSDYFKKDLFQTFLLEENLEHAICLSCGKITTISNFRSQFFFSDSDHRFECSHDLSILLILTGSQASSIIYFFDGFDIARKWGTIYFTSHGDPDIGLRLQTELYLNETMLNNLKRDLFDGTLLSNDLRIL